MAPFGLLTSQFFNSEREKAEQVLNQQTHPRQTGIADLFTNYHCLQTPPHPWWEDSVILIDVVFFMSYPPTPTGIADVTTYLLITTVYKPHHITGKKFRYFKWCGVL